MEPSHKFSHLQWYLINAGNTVHMACIGNARFSAEELEFLLKQFISHSPQLKYSANLKMGEHVEPPLALGKLCQVHEVSDPVAALGEFIEQPKQVFADNNLANTRLYCFNSKNDKKPAASAIVISSSHALMEGAESARLVRGQKSIYNAHNTEISINPAIQAMINVSGWLLAPFHLIASRFNKPGDQAGRQVVINLDRKSLNMAARDYGVKKRSLLFALPLFAMGTRLDDKLQKNHLISYSTLPNAKSQLEDSALNLRMQVGRIKNNAEFKYYVQNMETVLNKENTREVYSQAFYNAILGVHRKLQTILPSFYDVRFFSYVPYDFVLSLLPPHKPTGIFRKFFDGPVYCGSYTPGCNNCIYVPNRKGISLNFYLEGDVKEKVSALTQLLDELSIDWEHIL